MILFKNLKIRQRVFIFLAIMLILIFTIFSIYLIQSQQKRLKNSVSQVMHENLDDIETLFHSQNIEVQNNLNASIALTKHIFENTIQLIEFDSLIDFYAINQETQYAYNQKINYWEANGKQLQKNYEFVDFISQSTGATATIFQKIPDGYLRISTTVLNKYGERAIGTFIPNNSPVVQAIENGQGFRGRAYVVNDWYLTAYEPLYIDGKIKGIIYVGVKQLNYDLLKPIFEEKKYYKSGYPTLISGEGLLVIHPTIEGKSIKNTKLWTLMQEAHQKGQKSFRYHWPENENGEWKWLFLTYFEPLKSYIVVTVFEKDLYGGIKEIRSGIIISVIATLFLLMIGLYFMISPITKAINNLVVNISKMGKGEIVEKIDYPRNDEIGIITNSINTLIEGLSNTADFANEIERGNFKSQYTPLSDNDVLGQALIDMRSSLAKAQEEEQKRKKIEQQRSWATEGLAKFADILRQDNDDSNKLAMNVISNLVNFLEANQGGLFIINDNDTNNPVVELIAAFAYDRKRKMHKTLDIDEGLIGRCIDEKMSIYMTDIPPNYMEITSGLGKDTPKSLLITPLKVNNQVYGAIELASFVELEKYQIDFVEKVAESIASTIASVKINQHTARLLEESQQQSEELAAQEEEMRQNIEELQATQEESARREQMLEKKMDELKQLQNKLEAKDIIQKQQIEQLVNENNKKLKEIQIKEEQSRKILESSTDGVVIANQEGTIEFFNKAAEILWNFSQEEIIGKNIKILMPQKTAQEHDTYIANFITTKIPKVIGKGREIEIQTKDKQIKPAHLSLIENKIDGQLKFTAFFRDLTQEKQLEHQQNLLLEKTMANEFYTNFKVEKYEQVLTENNIPVPEFDENEIVKWNDELKLQLETIDQQHKIWIEMINYIFKALLQGKANEVLKKSFNDFMQYTNFHFTFEEQNMQKCTYPEIDAHIKEHRKFTEKVTTLNQKLQEGDKSAAYELLKFINTWLNKHIKHVDKQYVDCFKQNNIT